MFPWNIISLDSIYILQYNSVVDFRPLQVFGLDKQQQMSPV